MTATEKPLPLNAGQEAALEAEQPQQSPKEHATVSDMADESDVGGNVVRGRE